MVEMFIIVYRAEIEDVRTHTHIWTQIFLVIFNFLSTYTWNYTPGIFTLKIFKDLHLTSSQIQNFIWIYSWIFLWQLYTLK